MTLSVEWLITTLSILYCASPSGPAECKHWGKKKNNNNKTRDLLWDVQIVVFQRTAVQTRLLKPSSILCASEETVPRTETETKTTSTDHDTRVMQTNMPCTDTWESTQPDEMDLVDIQEESDRTIALHDLLDDPSPTRAVATLELTTTAKHPQTSRTWQQQRIKMSTESQMSWR